MNVAQWTASTRKLLEEMKAKKRHAERRARAADEEVRDYQAQIDGLACALKALDARAALPVPKAPAERAPDGRPTVRRLIEEYACANEGRVQVTEAAQSLVDAGHFDDVVRARSSLITELSSRMGHVVRLERGVYQVLSVNGTPTAAPA